MVLTARAAMLLPWFWKVCVDGAQLTWKSTVFSYGFISEIRLTATRAPMVLHEEGWRTRPSVSRQIMGSKDLLHFALFSFLLFCSMTLLLFGKWWWKIIEWWCRQRDENVRAVLYQRCSKEWIRNQVECKPLVPQCFKIKPNHKGRKKSPQTCIWALLKL